ncbi:MAG: InlB B-repeat-containing protein [Candidatus Peribacteria bacterium]|nr:InlB B-repeat-containing protein [Candidatus Peribacteria bacterium]
MLSGAVQYQIASCNEGYHPYPNANNYIGSYRCDANKYQVKYNGDYKENNNPALTTQTPTYDTSFSLAGNFNRVGYTLKGWSTTQQKLRNIAKQVPANYSPISYFPAKEGSRQLNMSTTATWNFTTNKAYPNYSTSNPEVFPLYAVWQRNSYTITFQAGSGTLYGAGGSCGGDNSTWEWSLDQSNWLNILSGMQANAKPNILAVSGTLADYYSTQLASNACGTPSSGKTCNLQGTVSLTGILLQQFSFTGTIEWSGGSSSLLPEQVISTVILSGTLLSGTQVITTGHLEMQNISLQNTGYAGIEYKGFIRKVLNDNVPVVGTLRFVSLQNSPSTCVNQTSAATCASAKCSWSSTSVAGDGKTATKTVVYDEKYDGLPIPTRVGYEFIGRYTTSSNTDL